MAHVMTIDIDLAKEVLAVCAMDHTETVVFKFNYSLFRVENDFLQSFKTGNDDCLLLRSRHLFQHIRAGCFGREGVEWEGTTDTSIGVTA